MNPTQKTIHLPIFNPKIEAGTRIGQSTIDEISFTVGLMAQRWCN